MKEAFQGQTLKKPKIEMGPQIGALTLQRGNHDERVIVNVHAVPDALNVKDDRPFVIVSQDGTEEIVLSIEEREIAETTFLGKPQPETIEELERLRSFRSKRIPKRQLSSASRRR